MKKIKHIITASARPIKVEEEDLKINSEVLQSITSHEVPDIISESGVRSTHNIETGIPCPAQVTIEVEEKSLYDPGGNYGEFYDNYCLSPNVTHSKSKELGSVEIPKNISSVCKDPDADITKHIKEENDTFSCYFCKTPFIGGLKVMHIVLGKQLPSSLLDPLTLLHCFGVQFPTAKKVDCTGFSTVDICSKCYIVISDCDILYPHLHSAVTKILEVWPDKMNGIKTMALNVTFDRNNSVPRNCKNSSLKDKKKLSLPDVQVSFCYSKVSDMSCKSAQNSKDTVREIFTCGFCGIVLSSEEDWSSHVDTEHKIIKSWQAYDMQTSLKHYIFKEVQGINILPVKCDKNSGERRCYACDSNYQSKGEFLKHLQEYHRITVERSRIVYRSNERKVLSKVTYKRELDDADEEQMLSCFSDGGVSVGDLNELEREYQNSECRLKQRNSAKSETGIKKVYAPHWRCRICGMLFSSHEVLTRHRSQSHPETTRMIKKKDFGDSFVSATGESKVKLEFRCPVCNQDVEDQDSLKAHLHAVHQKYMVVLKDKNPPSVDTVSQSERIRTSRRGRGAKCRSQPSREGLGYCVVLKGDGQGGVSDQRLRIEEELHGYEENVTTQEQTSSLDVGVQEKEKKVICGICGEEFDNRILMAEHSCSVKEVMDTVESNNSASGSNEIVMLECKLCDRRLHGVNALRIHMARVHGDPNKKKLLKHRCKVCSFQTKLRSQFNKHMKESHSIDVQPPVKCFVCGKMYNSQYLSRHIAVVHGTANNKKYSCKLCDMKYHDLVYLKRHVYFDHANTKWKCQVCHMEFEKYHQLRQHRVNVHSTNIFKCADCEKTFKRKGDLTTHRKRRHEAKVPSVCSFCSKAYSEPSKLRVHLIEKHGVPWENTLSRRYARHQQENNCLRRPKDVKMYKVMREGDYIQHKQIRNIQNESGLHRTDSFEEESEEDFHSQQKYADVSSEQHLPQEEIKGEVLGSYESTQVSEVPEANYNVVEVTEAEENMGNIGEISYIIYEETSS